MPFLAMSKAAGGPRVPPAYQRTSSRAFAESPQNTERARLTGDGGRHSKRDWKRDRRACSGAPSASRLATIASHFLCSAASSSSSSVGVDDATSLNAGCSSSSSSAMPKETCLLSAAGLRSGGACAESHVGAILTGNFTRDL